MILCDFASPNNRIIYNIFTAGLTDMGEKKKKQPKRKKRCCQKPPKKRCKRCP